MDISLGECKESLKSALDTSSGINQSLKNKGPGRVALSSSQGFRTRIWNDLEKAFTEEIYEQCKRVNNTII